MIPDGEDFTWTAYFQDGKSLSERDAHAQWDGTTEGVERAGWKAVLNSSSPCTALHVFRAGEENPVVRFSVEGNPQGFTFRRRRGLMEGGDAIPTLTICGWEGNYVFLWPGGPIQYSGSLETYQR